MPLPGMTGSDSASQDTNMGSLYTNMDTNMDRDPFSFIPMSEEELHADVEAQDFLDPMLAQENQYVSPGDLSSQGPYLPAPVSVQPYPSNRITQLSELSIPNDSFKHKNVAPWCFGADKSTFDPPMGQSCLPRPPLGPPPAPSCNLINAQTRTAGDSECHIPGKINQFKIDDSTGFLDLPGEIRNAIYDLVIPIGKHLTVTGPSLDHLEVGLTDAPKKAYRVLARTVSHRAPYSFPKALLRLNKMIHREVCLYVYGEQTFAFDKNSTFTAFLDKIHNDDPNLDPIRCLKNVSVGRFYGGGRHRVAEFLTGRHHRKNLVPSPVFALEKIHLTEIRTAKGHILAMRDPIADICARNPQWDILDIVTFPATPTCGILDCETTCGPCKEYNAFKNHLEILLRELAYKPRFPKVLTETNW